MGKSEYNECRTLPGESEQPQIILDAEAIYGLLIRAEVMMSKVDRARYANRAIEQILDVIREFILAYDFEDDREMHLKRMCANVAVFLRTMRIIAERNVICIMPRYDTATTGTAHVSGTSSGRSRRTTTLPSSTASRWRPAGCTTAASWTTCGGWLTTSRPGLPT